MHTVHACNLRVGDNVHNIGCVSHIQQHQTAPVVTVTYTDGQQHMYRIKELVNGT